MQNNVVKRTLLSFACAIVTAISLFAAFCLPIEREIGYNVLPHTSEPAPAVYELDNVTYIGSGFTVVDYTYTVERGKTAIIATDAPLGTEIDIRAYYASGKSSANAFIPKASENGTVTWAWRVPKNSSSEHIRIVLRSSDTYATLYIKLV